LREWRGCAELRQVFVDGFCHLCFSFLNR
jgi:hypothetical protein